MKIVKPIVALAALAALFGCGRQFVSVLRPNDPPQVTVEAGSVRTGAGAAFELRWSGSDHDGRVDHYLVAIDPASVDRIDESWHSTTEVRRMLAARVYPEGAGDGEAHEPMIVAIRAVDDQGGLSTPKAVAFFGGNIAPTVTITNPQPSSLITPLVPPTLGIHWSGIDPDGVFTTHPVKYKFRLFGSASELTPTVIAANPDTLRRLYGPKFASWDSVSGDTTETAYRNLVPNQEYVFAITAFDEAGDFDPVFSLNKNVFRFRVGYFKGAGPLLTFFGEGLTYTYLFPSWNPTTLQKPSVEVQPNQLLTFGWFGTPPPGASVAGYRWVLDPLDINDESTRSTPEDVRHWSARDQTTSVTLGPFDSGTKGTTHTLYVDAIDNLGQRSLGAIQIRVIKVPALLGDLLIVDDTRLRPDFRLSNGCLDRPKGPWPTAAELDTFLYARGGVPWLPQDCGTTSYPAGTLSPPGLFSGYRFDTLGTRGLLSGSVPLSTLMRYRHVLWLTNFEAALFNAPPSSSVDPTTALRNMSLAGTQNTITAYIAGGGSVWLAGGGVAVASQYPWDDRNNDPPGVLLFSVSGARGELAPGRFMYDVPAWRSEIRAHKSISTVRRFTGRFESGSPYAGLPALLQFKNAAPADPLPPLRSSGDFYATSLPLEYLSVANPITEGDGSAVDSLFEVTGGSVPPVTQNPHNVLMTYTHEAGRGAVLFSGFSLWSYKRAQLQQLVDFVLQQMWGISPASVTARAGVEGSVPRAGRTGVAATTRDASRIAARRGDSRGRP